MINIDNIINSRKETDPWEYICVDDILTQEAYEKIRTEMLKLEPILSNDSLDDDGIWLYKALKYGVSQEVVDIILEINKKLLKYSNKILDRFTGNNRSDIGYFSIPRLGFCPANAVGDLHDDGEEKDKALIMVIYIHPKESTGTKIYSRDDEATFVRDVHWSQNGAFLFVPKPDVTWHRFVGNDRPRLTLLFYYERMEDMGYINTLHEKEKIHWFYEKFGGDKISIELKDCD
jgi:hypothetical protein